MMKPALGDPAMAKRYVVYVDDNFDYMDESERYQLGEFEDCESAIAACKQIVDNFLARLNVNRPAEELFHEYTSAGEDPWIQSDDPECKFSAWEYAKARCRELAQ